MTSALTAIQTVKGIEAHVRIAGSGDPVVYFHGAGGLQRSEPLLDALATHYTVHAAEWPGFGEQPTESFIEDMLDFSLHGWDIVEALGLGAAKPHLIGHSSRIQILEELIRHIRGHAGIWFARHDEVAGYCKAKAGL